MGLLSRFAERVRGLRRPDSAEDQDSVGITVIEPLVHHEVEETPAFCALSARRRIEGRRRRSEAPRRTRLLGRHAALQIVKPVLDHVDLRDNFFALLHHQKTLAIGRHVIGDSG